jgi:hypothetical protein
MNATPHTRIAPSVARVASRSDRGFFAAHSLQTEKYMRNHALAVFTKYDFRNHIQEIHMTSASAATVTRMLETLPEQLQDRVIEHLREYIEDLREDAQWRDAFAHSQEKLVDAAREARQAIAKGEATPLDIDML